MFYLSTLMLSEVMNAYIGKFTLQNGTYYNGNPGQFCTLTIL
jgi:hypothetical protein